MKLSRPQRELLRHFDRAQYGQLGLRGNYLRTARSLQRLGLIEEVGYSLRWYGITDKGRRVAQNA